MIVNQNEEKPFTTWEYPIQFTLDKEVIKLYDPNKNIINWEELLKLPEFQALEKTPQNSIWHMEGNALVHTCRVAQLMVDRIGFDDIPFDVYGIHDPMMKEILVLSALCHDLGKAVTTAKGEDGEWHCKNHAHAGEKIAADVLGKLGYERDLIDTVCILVKYHMQPLYILKSKDPIKALLKLCNQLNRIDFNSLLFLKWCDCKASLQSKKDNWEDVLDEVWELFDEHVSYDGGDLVKITKIGIPKDSPYPKGTHPNFIDEGYTTTGKLICPVTVGFRTTLFRGFSSSPVTKIIDKNTFETKNSIYRIEKI